MLEAFLGVCRGVARQKPDAAEFVRFRLPRRHVEAKHRSWRAAQPEHSSRTSPGFFELPTPQCFARRWSHDAAIQNLCGGCCSYFLSLPWPRRQIWMLCDNQPSIGAMHFWHKCDGLVDWIPAWVECVRKEYCCCSCGVDCAKRGCRHLHHARVFSAADSSKRPHGECVGKFGCGVATVAQHQKHQAAILEECN